MNVITQWAEQGYLPDRIIRFMIRMLLQARLKKEGSLAFSERLNALYTFRDQLHKEPIAHAVDSANQQHYEVPADLFETFMGPHLKYSSGFWADDATTLAESEKQMLEITCERAQLEDGQQILELGCGWGSRSIWMARTYPNSTITAVSNSSTQKAFIDAQHLPNLTVITADMNTFETEQTFDRVVSVEMFEHMRNWHQLLERIHHWLNSDGRLFIHIFVHRELAYLFDGKGGVNWMSEHFFKEGMMPAESLLPICNQHLLTDQTWRVKGTHYAKTLRAWLQKIDQNRRQAITILTRDLGLKEAQIQWRRWRIFFMACEELFGFNGGNEWYVAHYRLIKR